MNFVILTEGGRSKGFGHLSRCLSFYDALVEKGHAVEFIVQGDDSVKNLLKNRVFKLLDWVDDLEAVSNARSSYQVVILDSFEISQSSVSRLCSDDAKLVAIDDYRRYTFSDSIVIDWTVNVETTGKHDHNKAANCLLLGLDYLVLRKPFWNPERTRVGDLGRLLVSLGGSDTKNLTAPLVQHLAARFPEIEIDVVVGPGNIDVNRLSLTSESRITISQSPGANRMKELIVDCDVAITTGGQILYELAAFAKPTIAIQVAENQKEDIAGWQEKGLLYSVFNWNDQHLFEELCSSIDGLKDRNVRGNLVSRIGGHIRGDGILKILEIIEKEVHDKTGA